MADSVFDTVKAKVGHFLGDLDCQNLIVRGRVKQQGGTVLVTPPGMVVDYAGATAPAGWLLCDGSSYPTSTFPALFGAIGYAWGGAGASFNVPDLRGRVAVGVGSVGTNTQPTVALGATGGEANHQLSVAELAAHNHGGSTSIQNVNHTHNTQNTTFTGSVSGGGTTTLPQASGVALIATLGISNDHLHSIPTDGSTNGHNTMQPYGGMNKIIKT